MSINIMISTFSCFRVDNGFELVLFSGEIEDKFS